MRACRRSSRAPVTSAKRCAVSWSRSMETAWSPSAPIPRTSSRAATSAPRARRCASCITIRIACASRCAATAIRWQAVPWDEALDEAAERLHAVQAAHGKSAVGLYIGNPTVHGHGAILGAQLFGSILGGRNHFDANSQDANPKLFASLRMYGELTSITVPDVDRTSYMLMLGANPAASNGSVMSLGDVRGRLRGIRERGGRLVLVDPRRTETAAWADEHIDHPPRRRRGLAGGAAAGDLLRAPRRRRCRARCRRRPRRAAARGGSLHARGGGGVHRHRGGQDARGGAPVRGGTGGGGLRAHRPVPRRLQLGGQLAVRGAQRRHRQLRPSRRGHVHDLRRGHRAAGAAPRCPRQRPLPLARARPAGARRHLAGGDHGRRDGDARPAPDQGHGDHGRQPGAQRAQRRAARSRPGWPGLHGQRSISTSTRRRATPTWSCRPSPGWKRSHYDLVFHAIAVRNTAKWSAPAVPRPAGAAGGLGHPLGPRLAPARAPHRPGRGPGAPRARRGHPLTGPPPSTWPCALARTASRSRS